MAKFVSKGNMLDPGTTKCHAGLYHLGKIGLATIWIGREAAVSNTVHRRPTKLIINCAADYAFNRPTDEEEGIVMGNKAARAIMPGKLFKAAPPVPQIAIDWPDYGTPPMRKSWWVRLSAALTSIDGDVIIHCFGGHGRSGTAASILAALNGWCPGEDPVLWLRRVYCRNVVEAEEQIFYIEEMTGLKLEAKPAKAWNTTTTTTGTQGTWTLSPKTKPPTMSQKKYKAYVRAAFKIGATPPTMKELIDAGIKRIVIVNGEWFRFDPDKRTFTYIPRAPTSDAPWKS